MAIQIVWIIKVIPIVKGWLRKMKIVLKIAIMKTRVVISENSLLKY